VFTSLLKIISTFSKNNIYFERIFHKVETKVINMKKILSLFLALTLVLANLLIFSSCSRKNEKSVYYLNFKPEIAEVYDRIAKDYKAETGVELRVVTAASNTYEQTLKSEIAKSEAPVIFQINGPQGYATWKDYCLDLSESELYNHLTDKSMALTDNGGVYGIPYVVEGYGIIYNKAITDKYFALPNRATSYKSMDDINNYQKFSEVVADMTAHKDELGIDGVFASTSLQSGENWRWQTHLANLPIYYELSDKDINISTDKVDTIDFRYAENYKNIFDLYINNSVTDPKLLGSKQVSDSMAEFALGRCAMVQNGNWAWSQISDVTGNTVKSEDIRFMPIYIGISGEETQGICIGTENFLAINKEASAEKQQLALDFLYWLFSSDTGKNYVINELDFIAPFDTFTENERPSDPLAKEVARWMNRDNTNNVEWIFTIFPSEIFKQNFGSALLQYAQGTLNWDSVKNTVVTDWENESKKS